MLVLAAMKVLPLCWMRLSEINPAEILLLVFLPLLFLDMGIVLSIDVPAYCRYMSPHDQTSRSSMDDSRVANSVLLQPTSSRYLDQPAFANHFSRWHYKVTSPLASGTTPSLKGVM